MIDNQKNTDQGGLMGRKKNNQNILHIIKFVKKKIVKLSKIQNME